MVDTLKKEWNNGGRLKIYGMALNFVLGVLLLVVGWSLNQTLDNIHRDIMETRSAVTTLKAETRENIRSLKTEHTKDVCRLDGRIDRTEDRLNTMGGAKWKP